MSVSGLQCPQLQGGDDDNSKEIIGLLQGLKGNIGKYLKQYIDSQNVNYY